MVSNDRLSNKKLNPNASIPVHDFWNIFVNTVMKSQRILTWKDQKQLYGHIQTILTKAITICAAANLIHWEEKFSLELIKIYQSENNLQRVAEEYARLGNSIKKVLTKGMDKFSLGVFYKVFYTGLGNLLELNLNR